MKTIINLLGAVLLLASAARALATVHYVNVNSTNATPPYTNWTTAATNIQDAVDAAMAGDEIVVTNGIYATGSRATVGDSVTNRVALDKPLNLRSANGPQSTVIDGGQSVRCVYLTNGASLTGFTLTNGYVYYSYYYYGYYYGGCGAYGGTLTNCTLSGNMVGGQHGADGGGAYGCTLNNCTLSANIASSPYGGYGGGAYNCTLNNCALNGNSVSSSGGGAYNCTLNNCTLSGNSGGAADNCTLNNCTLTGNPGGGAYNSTLNNCALSRNSASSGGGAGSCTLNNCTLTGNSATYGGGTAGGTLNNCVLSGNSAGSGGGAYGSRLNNCTVTGNSGTYGGGTIGCTLKNCIVYFNTATQGANYYGSDTTMNYCCTTPQPPSGVGNTSLDPQLASFSHLSALSPCRGAGNPAYASGTDIDGEAWLNPPSIGCDEYHAGALAGPLSVGITVSFTNVATDFAVQFTGLITGRTTVSSWDFGDSITVTNQPYTSHAWASPGDYAVILRAFNESQAGGTSATVTVHVVAQPVHYVAALSGNPVAPYTSWATAATNIQDAVYAATVPGAQVVVTNGAYGAIHAFTTHGLTVRSVNGSLFTVINGGGSNTCAVLANDTRMSGFTLTNGVGGAAGGTLSDCTLSGNFGGGGASVATLNNCTLSGNSGGNGGGAFNSTLNNCTLSGNSALGPDGGYGGGAYGSTLSNCTLSGNSAASGGGGVYDSTLNNCTLSGNSASGPDGGYGGGAGDGILNNCALSGNSAVYGGGVYACILNNCTLTGNSARSGGGVYASTLNNCIAYFNTASQDSNYSRRDSNGYNQSTLNYCCTTPQPTNGVGNISLDPQLASASHLSATSPCRGAGSAAYASGTDIDGEPWLSPPSIGCDEYHAGALTGPLSVGITASFTNVLIGFTVQLTAVVDGRTADSSWDFGDGITATNQPYTSHAWAALGDYAVVLRAYNESQPGGISATVIVHVRNGIHYVAANSANPVAPYASWDTAATNIQDAINAVEPGGPVVVVATNGTYASVAASGTLMVRSVNGALFTTINGSHSNVCASLMNGASLSGFTLTNGAGGASGGTVNNCTLIGNAGYGASSSTLSNCTLAGNAGMGASSCKLNNCTVTGNSGGGASGSALNNCAVAGNSGVGASSSTLINCTVTGNSGGGASGCTLNNCIVYFNTAASGANYDYSSTLNYCCTTPQPANGVGNISLDPQLASSWHLSAGSPCRGAGNAAFASGTDMDGEAWLSPPSMGCDEYHVGAVTGPLSVGISASFTNVLMGFTVQLAALIEGRTTGSMWDFGDGITITNQPYASHAWTALGDYAVVLRAYNETQPGGISATVIVHVRNGVHYVAANNPNPAAPYASWTTAATNIQDAINAVEPGGPVAVVVTNGTYSPIAGGGLLTVRSVNGPLLTLITGDLSKPCVTLSNSANVAGFTLTNGTGGAAGGTLDNCALTGNGWYGASGCTLYNCALTGNHSYGAYSCTMSNCIVAGNAGDGADYCTLNNCTLENNSGSGAYSSTLNNCAVSANFYSGAASCTLTNCTLAGNCRYYGVGAASSTLNNCIVYFNGGANYDSYCTLIYCCTTPQPTNGVGNISSDPHLASLSHLRADSPCRGAGNATYVSGTDIDGEAWANPPSIGCDEGHAASLTGPLSVTIIASYTNVLIGYAVQFTALIDGRVAASSWDFGDGTAATNRPLTSHAWAALGDYSVVLHAFNQSYPGGISATMTVHVVTGLHYVSADSTNPVAPYTSWGTAAPSIQEAINAAEPGASQVLVTNGTYGPIYVPAAMTVRSINGAQLTTINGGCGTRCASLGTGASLSGFTLANGYATDYGGGAYGGTLNNCTLTGNLAEASLTSSSYCASYDPFYHFCRLIGTHYSVGDSYGGGAAYCTLNNCTLSGNTAQAPLYYSYGDYYSESTYSVGNAFGGGAAFCTLNDCTLTDNQVQTVLREFNYGELDNNGQYGAAGGGGVYSCTLTNCALSNNRATGDQFFVYDYYDYYGYYLYVGGYGDGALDSTLNNCTLSGHSGEAAYSCTLLNCALTGNPGSGAISSTLNNCAVSANSGFGASSCSLTNCTLTGNSSGAYNSALNNCIAYFNSGKNYDSACTLNYCCTTPQPTNGVANMSADPQLASALHLSALSPCRGAGNAAYATGTDIDGEPWGDPPSIGCDEYHAGALTGPLSVEIAASFTNVAVGFAVNLTGLIEGRTTASTWGFADGNTATNEPYISHAWSAPGDYAVLLRAFNDSVPGGVSATVTVHVVAEVHYVGAGSIGPAAPYTSWATAATNIQDAVDAAIVPGAVVLVTNGTYAPISVTGAVNLRSVNGPLVTTINGNQSNLCVSLGSSATLTGLTLTNGAGGASGGTLTNCTIVGNLGSGASGCMLNNCILSGNSASYNGGGANNSTLNNCLLTGNSATNSGGGAYQCTLNNCTLTGNSSIYSGGAYACALNNCIIYFNTGQPWANYDLSSRLNHCCTTPQPVSGAGNISADPELASASHLSAGSPCRGTGNAAFASSTDIDGEDWANPPSIGCDEYHPGAVTGPLSLAISAQSTNVAVGFSLQLTALIGGRISDSVWEFGDGYITINEPYTSYAWDSPGDYQVTLWAFNDSHPNGVRATVTIHVITGIHYVAANNTNPAAPYTSWATAATNIQDAIDAAAEPGSHVLVTNGIYSTGWRAVSGTTNRLVIHPYLTLQSVNGPQYTTIDGGHAVRCVYLAGISAISGFTLANGAVSGYIFGGGVLCETSLSVVSNCVLIGNLASSGGGAYSGLLNNCTLSANVITGSDGRGGGAYGSALNNCTLTGNSSTNSYSGSGGGAYFCTLSNCTLTANSCSTGGGAYNCTLSYCTLSNNSAGAGAGAYACALNNCTLTGNFGPGPYGSYGGGAYSCTLNDCTLTGNSAVSGGGAHSCTLNNCILSGNVAPYYVYCLNSWCYYEGNGGGAASSTLNNCTLAGNFAGEGGGAADSCNLNNCTLTANSATYFAGGAASSTLNNCTLSGNSTSPSFYGYGGGASQSTLTNCILTGNSTRGVGGGAYGGTLNNCTLKGNSATGTSGNGGGAYGSTLLNCWLTGNSASGPSGGGGTCSSFLNNCTLTGNSATGTNGGGACSSTLNNCILFYNTASSGANYDSSSVLSYCCTTPLPASGTNNTDAEPRLASTSHLSANSPCIGRGSAAFASGVDIDGEPWANPPSIGCDEYHVGNAKGPLSVAINVPFTNITRGFTLGLTALIEGQATASLWEFSDGITVSNQPYISRAWTSVGDYTVVLRAYNESWPGGISATVTVHVVTTPPVYYVAASNANPVAPYTSWATAATSIQDAVDAATVPGALVLVTNGTYATGGRTFDGYTTNRVTVDKPLSLRSVNGPQFTIIDGAHWVRCVYLTNGASLSGFTLTNGWGGLQDGGGGVNGGTVTNCVLAGNLAGYGGGARDSVLNNCALTSNSADYYGGGAYGCTLNGCSLLGNNGSSYNGGGAYYCALTNCTLTTNSAGAGGGAHSSTLDNCTLTGNSAYSYGGGAYNCTLNNCLLTGNVAYWYGGGGAGFCALNNCLLKANSSSNGGGANSCTLNNCILTGNSADNSGGGAEGCTLNNCTLTGNSATGTYGGGGASYCTLNNCIVYFNTATNAPNFDTYYGYTALNHCCTTPLPAYGVGNITNSPLFVNTNGWANLRLQSSSPCINAGKNFYVTNATDLDGNPRIAGSTVDIGAYEFQVTGLNGFTAWLWQYGLPIDGSADFADSDGDGMNNWQEWITGTHPTDATSALRLLLPVPTAPGVLLRWNSDTNHAYFVERASGFSPLTFSLLRTNVSGQPGTTTFIDTTAPLSGAAFYRVGTVSTNGSLPLRLQTPLLVPAGVAVTWTSVTNRSYFLQRSRNLAAQQAFSTVQSNIVGQAGTTTFIDTSAVGAGPWFYRVGVGN